MPEKQWCLVEGCSRLARSEGLCARHKWLAGEGLLALETEAQRLQADPDDMHATGAVLPCSVEGCETARDIADLCLMHHRRKRQGAANWDDPEPWLQPAAGFTCTVEGCSRERASKGLCTLHYSRKWRGAPNWADPEPRKPGRQRLPPRFCLVDGCGRNATAHGLCPAHYSRKRKGEPNWDDPVPRPRPPREKKTRPGPVPPDIAAALAADYAIAKRVNGSTSLESPARETNRRFNASIVALAAAGHTYDQIAEAAGATRHMVNMRLKKIRAAAPQDEAARQADASAQQEQEQTPAVETCINGHPRIADNLTTCSDGKVRCKVCRREAQRRRQKRLQNNPELRPEITDDMHGGPTAYRYGCRCGDCRRFHSEQSQEYKWMGRFGPGAPMGPEIRSSILSALRRTGNVAAAAAEVGVPHQSVYGAVKAVPGFGILVKELTRAQGSAGG